MKDALACSACSGPVSSQSKTGRCRACALAQLNRDPGFQMKRQRRLAEAMDDNAVRARHSEGCKRGAAKRMADPEKLAALQDIGRRFGAKNIVHAMTPEARAKCAIASRAHRLSWCPVEYWPLNKKLKRDGIRLAERQRIILEQVPGTAEHARVQIANVVLAQQLRAERERAQAY